MEEKKKKKKKKKEESDPTCLLCNNKPLTLEDVLSSFNRRYTWRHNGVLDELVRFIKNYMKSEPTISTQNFVQRDRNQTSNYTQSKVLDQVEIGRYLLTYFDGIMITQKQYLVKVCN